ncbi:MAG: FAD-binding protein [Candidatus Methanomethylicus sp.]|nr:FAD-binding protein [Candidatus Methanomethylicus sp.]
MTKIRTDVLVVGGGLAGLCAAISSSSDQSETLIVTKTLVGDATTTSMAAGVISAVTAYGDSEDSVEKHLNDTLAGGANVNDKMLARAMVYDASKYFERLLELGIEFEGETMPRVNFIPGHSKPRSYVIKGKGIGLQHILRNAVMALGTKVMERTLITSLVKDGQRVVGAIGYSLEHNEIVEIKAKSTILATGGPGELYSRTLMPTGSTGYGPSLGFRAGAELVDMEFVQFYPTMVYEEALPRLFIDYSPLLRQGGDILDEDGVSVFKKENIDEPYKLKRDAFSLLLAKETIKENGHEKRIFLDCTRIKKGEIASNPMLSSHVEDLQSKRVPILERKIGISPYAHFFMGGFRADANGATTLLGLYVAGESMGGPHGANRIGGNAFAAAVSFGFRSGLAASLYSSTVEDPTEDAFDGPLCTVKNVLGDSGQIEASSIRRHIQDIMWEKVGLIRTRKGLEDAIIKLNSIREKAPSSKNPLDRLLIPMMIDTAEAVTLSAMVREESRGAHYRLDFPIALPEWQKRVVLKMKENECIVEFVPV